MYCSGLLPLAFEGPEQGSGKKTAKIMGVGENLG